MKVGDSNGSATGKGGSAFNLVPHGISGERDPSHQLYRMVKAYRIQIYSPIAFIAASVTIMVSGASCIKQVPMGDSPIATCTASAFVLAIAFFVASRMSTAKIKIEMDERGFHHRWIKRFLFSREPDIDLTWAQVVDYFFEEDRTVCRFQLTLQHKQRYRFYRQTIWPTQDDLRKFQRDFPHVIRGMNTDAANDVVLGKTIYEENWFNWVMAVMSILTLLLLLNAFRDGGSSSQWSLGTLAVAVLYYWLWVWRKKASG